MEVKIYRNFFIENIVKDLEFSKSIDNLNIKVSDYSTTFNFEQISKDKFNIFFIDFSEIKNFKTFIKNLKKNIEILKKKKISYFYFYYYKKDLDNIKNSINLKNICTLNKNKKFYKKGLIFDSNSYIILFNYLNLIISIKRENMIRSIALDLDNTLWNGILGEDEKVEINKYYKKNLDIIVNLISKGLIISLVSKNNILDVERFMNKSKLKKIFDYSKKYISWNEKTSSLNNLIKWSKLHQKNILFFDDNPHELLKVKNKFKFLHVFNSKNIKQMNTILNFLSSCAIKSSIDKIRQIDLKNNELREKIKSQSINSYLMQTNPEVKIFGNSKKHINRIVEMSNKINQFDLSNQRFNQKNINFFINSKEYDLYCFSLKDNYGDSGIVGYCLIKKDINVIYIDDIKISCRALGRYIEPYFIFNLIILYKKNFNFVKFNYKKTNRNQPVKIFINKYLGTLKKIKIHLVNELDYFKYVKKK